MKMNLKTLAIVLTSIALFLGCKSNLEDLKKKRSEVSKEIAALQSELEKIDEKIAKLEPTKENAVLVKFIEAKETLFEQTVDLQSTVKTDQDVMVYPEFAGILKLYVKEGQRVGAGQVIGDINDGGLSQQLAQAKIQASLAQTAFQKQQNLWKQNIGSEIQFLQSKTNAEAAQKQVAAIQAQLGRTKIKAPFSGIVDKVITQNGQVVGPGMPIIQLVSLGQMKIEAEVPETYISTIKSGSSVKIEIPNLNRSFSTQISKVGSSINQMNRTFNIEVNIPNPDGMVKPNLMAKIKIVNYQNPQAFVIPTSAINQDAENRDYIFTIQNPKGKTGIAKKTTIVKGKSSGEFTEVLMGLKAGDKVVTDGVNMVSDGKAVVY